MLSLLKHVIEKLVDNVEAVNITEVSTDSLTVLEVKVSKEDVGKIIGRNGKTAEAIRTIMNNASTKTKKRLIVQIVDAKDLT